ncbi:MAG TPA: hypothetical protein DFS52_27475 [Myxococcales bacterium]|jgi:hypothetical protein|nr:hypothetical protein [Myxococcales bacterium]
MNRNATILGAALIAATLLAATAHAATPAMGVPQQIRSGFFADVNMGGVFTLGGKSVMTGLSKPSNAQAYLQLGVGYDVLEFLSVGVHFGLGASAASCFSTVDNRQSCVSNVDPKLVMADNFTVSLFSAEVSYRHHFNSRFTLQPRLHLGYGSFDPVPMDGVNGAPVFGVAVGAEYATNMDHFSIGLEVDYRFMPTLSPMMQVISFYPKIKYTF